MATLYLGRISGLGGFERLFAIKMIHEHLSRERGFVEMFLNEARIAARVQHPNVIPVYEVGMERGRHFLAMDYISGETLGLALKHTWNAGRPFPVQISVHVLAAIAEGLHAAHELASPEGQALGVVHRDVAPQNIMLGYDGIPRLMDFGIAKAFDSANHTRPGTLKGTIAYMAPEQVRCKPLDRRADVFALGTVLWESTVGMRLFKADNDIGTATRVVRMQIPRPSQLRQGYPPALEAIVLSALERDPERRPPNARALGEALQSYLAADHGRVTAADVQDFMRGTFPARHRQRQEMERQAREPEPPPTLEQLPREDSGSLGMLSVEEAIELDESAEPIPFPGARLADLAPAPARPPAADLPAMDLPAVDLPVPDRADLKDQRRLETLVVRPRAPSAEAEATVPPGLDPGAEAPPSPPAPARGAPGAAPSHEAEAPPSPPARAEARSTAAPGADVDLDRWANESDDPDLDDLVSVRPVVSTPMWRWGAVALLLAGGLAVGLWFSGEAAQPPPAAPTPALAVEVPSEVLVELEGDEIELVVPTPVEAPAEEELELVAPRPAPSGSEPEVAEAAPRHLPAPFDEDAAPAVPREAAEAPLPPPTAPSATKRPAALRAAPADASRKKRGPTPSTKAPQPGGLLFDGDDL